MRWLRTLLVGALATIGGLFGNLLSAGTANAWGHVFALWRVVGTIAGVSLVLGLDALVSSIFHRFNVARSRDELLRQLQSQRRELRRLRRSYESGLPWTSSRTIQMLAYKQRLEAIKDRLGRGLWRIPDDPIDSYPVPQLTFLQRAGLFLGKRSSLLYAFPILTILAFWLSPTLERSYLANAGTPPPLPTSPVLTAQTSIPTATETSTPERLTPSATSTGTPSPMPTRTSTPTETASPSATPTQTSVPTPTATPSATPTRTPEPTPTSTATAIPSATPTQTPQPTRTLTETPSSAPTWTPAPTSTVALPEASPPVLDTTPSTSVTLAALPAPMLIEPEGGGAFSASVRFKFSWIRMLAENERFSIRLESVGTGTSFEWRPNAQDIIDGGGNVSQEADGYRFEVNGGMGSLPPGEAVWKVAVFSDGAEAIEQITPWSEERPIIRR